ncbi:unnamed protein product [Protopolystoma xenopodis]|uniref:Uncharacterized protein n=1 Tax=Protopolystoma xenopodis TaxID=117903 RepID=A0A3S5CC81_9PLAT|nr:unnamed protein product [Protopolystoma xenopodis]
MQVATPTLHSSSQACLQAGGHTGVGMRAHTQSTDPPGDAVYKTGMVPNLQHRPGLCIRLICPYLQSCFPPSPLPRLIQSHPPLLPRLPFIGLQVSAAVLCRSYFVPLRIFSLPFPTCPPSRLASHLSTLHFSHFLVSSSPLFSFFHSSPFASSLLSVTSLPLSWAIFSSPHFSDLFFCHSCSPPASG